MDIHLDMAIPDYLKDEYDKPTDLITAILWFLKEVGLDVTDVYLFDHGNEEGQEFDGQWLAAGTSEFAEFCSDLEEVTNPDDPTTDDWMGPQFIFGDVKLVRLPGRRRFCPTGR